jgi:hypothetical protein
MSDARRRADKKRRREKRLAKREPRGESLQQVLHTIERLAQVPEPARWPGCADGPFARPDRVKFELANFVETGAGRVLCRRLERQLEQGLISYIPELAHWGMEEFFWHGLPGEPWHPVDQFLQSSGNRFSPAQASQFALWKQARIGFFEVGPVADDLVWLREIDVITRRPVGSWIRAIALNIGGVNIYRGEKGKLNVTYLAPWSPDEDIFCAMGYGLCVPASGIDMLTPLVTGLRAIEAVTFPLPWHAGKAAAKLLFEQWRQRDWVAYMSSHVSCPFLAIAAGPNWIKQVTISKSLNRSVEEFRKYGLYYEILKRPPEACGATAIYPLDHASPTALAFAEYREYRRLAGPPLPPPRAT